MECRGPGRKNAPGRWTPARAPHTRNAARQGRWVAAALAAALAGQPLAAAAQAPAPPGAAPSSPAAAPSPNVNALGPISPETRQAERLAAWKAAVAAATVGPASVPLLDKARLALPEGMIFIPKPEAARVLSANGNRTGSALVGLVTAVDEREPWIVTVNHVAEGYVRDDDAAKLKAGDILEQLQASNEEGNKDRARRGFPELQLLGWTQPPAYDAATHRLSWSLRVKTKEEANDEAGINFNTRALGRDGYFSLNLVTEQDRIAEDSKVSAQLLSGLQFVDGKRYADFDASTDQVAGYGLAALIGVVAAKKLGLLALIAAFAAKFAKVGILAVVGLGAATSRLFRRTPRA